MLKEWRKSRLPWEQRKHHCCALLTCKIDSKSTFWKTTPIQKWITLNQFFWIKYVLRTTVCFIILHLPPDFSRNHGNHKNWVPSMKICYWFKLEWSKKEKIDFFFQIADSKKLNFSSTVCAPIITRGLYILNPLFKVQKCFFKEVFSENCIFMYG